MNKSKALVILALLLYILSVAFQFRNEDVIANALKSIILPVVTVLYFITVEKKTLFFVLFLMLFSISELMVFIAPYIPRDLYYYLANCLYACAYTSLVVEVLKSISLSYSIKHYIIHILVLTILNIYLIYVLQIIIEPHVDGSNKYYLELAYNMVMLILLSVTLINYFYRDNVKALYFFLGSLCIVFAEVIWVAYTYITARELLKVVSTTLYLLSYYFFYKQSTIKQDNVKREEEKMYLD